MNILGFVDIIKILLEYGSDVNAKDDYENTPLHWSAYGGKSDGIKILLDHGAKINIRNKKGYTPLHLAAHEGNF